MYSANHSIPKQKLADSKKTETWKKECVEAYIGLSNTNGYGNRRSKLQQLYDYYNGHVARVVVTFLLRYVTILLLNPS